MASNVNASSIGQGQGDSISLYHANRLIRITLSKLKTRSIQGPQPLTPSGLRITRVVVSEEDMRMLLSPEFLSLMTSMIKGYIDPGSRVLFEDKISSFQDMDSQDATPSEIQALIESFGLWFVENVHDGWSHQ